MFLRHNIFGILWAILILILCGLPASEFPVSPPFKYFDHAVHFYLYAQFTLLLIIGFLKQFQFKKLRNRAIFNSFLISILYGILIELLQKFIFKERSIELMDIVSNFSGTIIGIAAFFIIYGKPSN